MAHQRVCIICGGPLSLGRIESRPAAKTCPKSCSANHSGNLNRAAIRRFNARKRAAKTAATHASPSPALP